MGNRVDFGGIEVDRYTPKTLDTPKDTPKKLRFVYILVDSSGLSYLLENLNFGI